MRHLFVLVLALAACAGPRGGRIAVGQTAEQVEAELGKPDKRYARGSEKESLDIWAWDVYRGPFGLNSSPAIGQTPRDVPGGGIKDDEQLRVVFKDGKVVFFESRQR
jgi:hypothetical protein